MALGRFRKPRSASPEPPTTSAPSSTPNKRDDPIDYKQPKQRKEKLPLNYSQPLYLLLKLVVRAVRLPPKLLHEGVRSPAAAKSTKLLTGPHSGVLDDLPPPAAKKLLLPTMTVWVQNAGSSSHKDHYRPARVAPPFPDKSRITISRPDSTHTSAISVGRSTTTLVNFDPEVLSSACVPQKEHIDFGSLVPEQRLKSRKSIYLKFVDDGPRATILK
ncbi:hypothetical protein FS837_007506, partial [Tulasnella sp. UAMH 9824]